jgi:hypothetical protein
MLMAIMAQWFSGEVELIDNEVSDDGKTTYALWVTTRTFLRYRLNRLGLYTCLATAMVAKRYRARRCASRPATSMQ